MTKQTQVKNGKVSEGGIGVNVKRGKKTSVSFPEMRRLMKTYGSIKCLRNHDNVNAKEDSIRRKFYRWFPDLDERFERDDEGIYYPKLGHEMEIIYRGKMRKLDGQILSKKRTGSRKEHSLNPSNESKRKKASNNPSKENASKRKSRNALILARAYQAGVIVDTSDAGASPAPVLSAQMGQIDREIDAFIARNFPDDPQESAPVMSDFEPADISFLDYFETSFFSPIIQECPSSQTQACIPTVENANSNGSSQILQISDTNYDTPFCDDVKANLLYGRCDGSRISTWESDVDTTSLNCSPVKSVEELDENDLLVSDDSDSVFDVVSDDSWDLVC